MRKTAILWCLLSLVLALVLVIPIQAQENWKILCDSRTGAITITRDMPPAHQIVLQQFFPSEQAARQWVNANYPNWRCK